MEVKAIFAVGRPGRFHVPGPVVGQPSLVGPVGVHDVDLAVAHVQPILLGFGPRGRRMQIFDNKIDNKLMSI